MIEGHEDLSHETLNIEKVLFGLRMNEGIEMSWVPLNKKSVVKGFLQDGFLAMEGSRLKVTDEGRLVLDELSARLV